MNNIRAIDFIRQDDIGSPMLLKYGMARGKLTPGQTKEREIFSNAVSVQRIEDAKLFLEKSTGDKWVFDSPSSRDFIGHVHPGLEGRLQEIEDMGLKFRPQDLFILAPKSVWGAKRVTDPVAFLELPYGLFWPVFAWDGDREIPLMWKPRLEKRLEVPGKWRFTLVPKFLTMKICEICEEFIGPGLYYKTGKREYYSGGMEWGEISTGFYRILPDSVGSVKNE